MSLVVALVLRGSPTKFHMRCSLAYANAVLLESLASGSEISVPFHQKRHPELKAIEPEPITLTMTLVSSGMFVKLKSTPLYCLLS